jgi:alpha-amylase/alpha-mannosidase (GH57 family)
MASTAAERKAKERLQKKSQGMVLKQIWLLPETIKIIEKFKDQYDCTDEDAINELIKKTLT